MKSYFCLKEEKILARDKKGDRQKVAFFQGATAFIILGMK